MGLNVFAETLSKSGLEGVVLGQSSERRRDRDPYRRN